MEHRDATVEELADCEVTHAAGRNASNNSSHCTVDPLRCVTYFTHEPVPAVVAGRSILNSGMRCLVVCDDGLSSGNGK